MRGRALLLLLCAACGEDELRLESGRVELTSCSERCVREVSFDGRELTVRITGAYQDAARVYVDLDGELTADGERQIAAELETLRDTLSGLPDTSGCPGCDGEPSASLTFDDAGESRTLAYEFLSPPTELAGLGAIVREIYTALGSCSTTTLARYVSGLQECN
jgi:hypothetical protein